MSSCLPLPRLSSLWAIGFLAGLGGCDGRISSPSRDAGEPPDLNAEVVQPVCRTLDFDTDGDGAAIARGDVVADAYSAFGVELRAWRDQALTVPGLPVAFDSADPTGGDDDLAFRGLQNLLISQEDFTAADEAAGFVDEPDDDAGGAVFQFSFLDPQCIVGLTVLDIDFNEPPAKVRSFDAAGVPIFAVEVGPAGDNERIDAVLPEQRDCHARELTVHIESSGALDRLEVCACEGGGAPRTWFLDFDADGYGDPEEAVESCEPPMFYVDNDLDCDDLDDAVNPDALEVCDGADNNCDGEVDEDAVDAVEWFIDGDGDGFGDPGSSVLACEQPAGTVVNDDDCDDGDPAVNPDATEVTNGVDDDCDGDVDE